MKNHSILIKYRYIRAWEYSTFSSTITSGSECYIVYIMGDHDRGKSRSISSMSLLECTRSNRMKPALTPRKCSTVPERTGHVSVLVEKFMIVWGGYNVSPNYKQNIIRNQITNIFTGNLFHQQQILVILRINFTLV